MNYLDIHAKIKKDKGLNTKETNELISSTIGRSFSTVEGYQCPSRKVPAMALKLLNALFNKRVTT